MDAGQLVLVISAELEPFGMIPHATGESIAKISVEALLFELAAQRFAVALGDVIEVVRAVAIRRLPSAPAITLGIIDVRGEIIPVLDVRARFGLAA